MAIFGQSLYTVDPRETIIQLVGIAPVDQDALRVKVSFAVNTSLASLRFLHRDIAVQTSLLLHSLLVLSLALTGKRLTDLDLVGLDEAFMAGHIFPQLGDILLKMVNLLGASFILSLKSSQLTLFPTKAFFILFSEASNQLGDALIFFLDISLDFFNGLFEFQEMSLFLLEKLKKRRVCSLKRLILMSIDVFGSEFFDRPFKIALPSFKLIIFLD